MYNIIVICTWYIAMNYVVCKQCNASPYIKTRRKIYTCVYLFIFLHSLNFTRLLKVHARVYVVEMFHRPCIYTYIHICINICTYVYSVYTIAANRNVQLSPERILVLCNDNRGEVYKIK